MPTNRTSGRTLPVYLVGALLLAYAMLTGLWLIPEWGQIQGAEAFTFLKHLGIVLLIVVILYFQPQFGIWSALVYCVIVPLEGYALVFQELAQVASGGPWSLALIDVTRFALLLSASVVSAWAAYRTHFRQRTSADAKSNA